MASPAKDSAVFWTVEETLGRTVWGPKVPTLKGTEELLSCVQCFLYHISSSINVSILHSALLDTFWTDLVHYVFIYLITGSLSLFNLLYPIPLLPTPTSCNQKFDFFFFKGEPFKDFIYLFLNRGEGREKERERNINVWLPLAWTPTRDLACNPGMCPDWESNLWPFGSQAGAQCTELHQPGLNFTSFFVNSSMLHTTYHLF